MKFFSDKDRDSEQFREAVARANLTGRPLFEKEESRWSRIMWLVADNGQETEGLRRNPACTIIYEPLPKKPKRRKVA